MTIMTSRTSRTSRTDKRGRARALTGREIGGFRRRLLEEFRTHASEVEAVEAEALEPSGGARFQDVDESGEESALEERVREELDHGSSPSTFSTVPSMR